MTDTKDLDISEVLAYIKYEGDLVDEGYLDARKAGEALIGIDEALRYFLYREDTKFQQIEFEIPVRVRKGSWETLFPENFDEILIKTALTWSAAKYTGSALSQMAKNDFKDIGFKEIFKRAFKGMTWVVKIAKHLGTLKRERFENIKFSKDNKEVAVANDQGEELWVPVEYLEFYTKCPDQLFAKLAKVIEEERELVIGYNDKGETQEVRVNYSRKFIFCRPDDDEEEVLFPELTHNSYVELEGHITRGNEKSNTIGLLYNEHILTCYPADGNIKEHKHSLFTNVLLKGYVDRMDKEGNIIERRPRIRFIQIVDLNDNNNKRQTGLFDKE